MAAVLPPQHDVVDGVHAPRPGGLLVGAASVPLGVAVLLAAGALPWGARAVLGLAVVVLGAAVLRTRGTAAGARLGAGIPAGLGVVLVLVGAALAAASLAVGVTGAGDEGPVSGVAAVALWVLVAGTGIVLLGLPQAGRATTRAAEGAVGIATGLAVAALAGPGALGLGGTESTALLLVVALLGTAAAATARSAAGGPRIAALLAATVLAYLTGEGTGLVGLATDGLVPATTGTVGDVARTAAQTAGLLLGSVLLGLAFLRRDPLAGGLAAALLIVPAEGNGDPSVTVPAVVAALGVVLAAVLVRSAGARDALGRVLRHTGPERSGAGAGVEPVRSTAALAAALAVLAVQVVGLGGGPDPGWLGPLVALAALAGTFWVAWSRADAAGTVAAIAGLAAVVVAQPALALLFGLSARFPTDHATWVGVVGLVQAAAAGAVVLRRRHPMVLGLAAILVAGAVSNAIVSAAVGGGPSPVVALVAVVGVPTLGLLAVGATSVFGDASVLRAVQGVALGLAYVAVGSSASFSSIGQLAFTGSDGGPADGPRVVWVLLAVLLPLGLALVAASTARRASVAATVGIVLGTASAAAFAGTVGAWAQADVTAGRGPVRLTDPLLGFDASGSGLAGMGAAWPVLFGVLGAALLVAGWWLESRRPAPAGGPLGDRAAAARD